MLTRPEKIRLGIFLTFGFSLVLGFFVFFVGKNLLRSSDSYIIVFTATSLSGLDNGAPVKYQGLKIGSVKDISIDPEDISKITGKSKYNMTLKSVGDAINNKIINQLCRARGFRPVLRRARYLYSAS